MTTEPANQEILQRFLAIETRPELAALIGVSDRELCHVLYGRKERSKYRTFEIPKKRGGTRSISAPPARLKNLQARLAELLYDVSRPRGCVHGFARGRSIVTNAEKHCGKRYVLNLDLKDFFPTIHLGRVAGVFRNPPFKLPAPVATVIGQIACKSTGQLPQGAPTSPVISNLVCGPLDTALQRLAQANGCFYSRYVDDLSFSTNRNPFPDDLGRVHADGTLTPGAPLAETISNQGFEINSEKVWLRSRSEHQEVTGLTVNEFPNVNRRSIKQTRAILHNWDITSLPEAAQVFSRKYSPGRNADEEAFRRFVHGRLSFIRMVRGKDDPVYRRLATKLAFIEEKHPPDSGGAGPSPMRGLPTGAVVWQRVYERLRKHLYVLHVSRSSTADFSADAFGTAFAYDRDELATAGHNLDVGDIRAEDLSRPGDLIAPMSVKLRNDPLGLDCGLVRLPPNPSRTWPGQIPTQERIPEVGEEVAAIGYPRVGLRQTEPVFYPGVVSSLVRNLGNDVQFIQVSFRHEPGLSGAPLVDKRGYVLGIVVENVEQKAEPREDAERNQVEQPRGSVEHSQVMPIGYLHRLRHDEWKGIGFKQALEGL